MPEILTLQFGNYASFVGAHFWNLQSATSTQNLNRFAKDESFVPYLDASSLFRQGVDERTGQVTSYNPRVVIFEKRSELGILSSHGLSTLHSSDIGTLRSKDFVRRQVQSLLRNEGEESSQEPEVWLRRRHEDDSTEYIQDLNQIPKHSEWNTLLGRNLVDDSLHNVDIPENMQEHPGDFASIYKWNKEDMKVSDMEEEDTRHENITNTQELIQANSVEKLEQIRNELHQKAKRWNDFLEPILHPKSLCPIQDPLLLYNDYCDETKTLIEEEYYDRIRFFLEECDYLQGFQILLNANDGWGALSARTIDCIRDDIGTKKSIIAFTCSDLTPEEISDTELKTLRINLAAGMSDLYEKVDMVVPLTAFSCNESLFPTYHFQDATSYHTSSILATVIDTATTNYRKFKNNTEMFRLITSLQPRSSHRISTLSASLPSPIFEKQSLFNFYKSLEPVHTSAYFSTISPYNRAAYLEAPIAHSIVVRGIDKIPLYDTPTQSFSGINQGMSAEEMQNQIKLLMQNFGREQPSKDKGGRDVEDSILGQCFTHQEMLERYLTQTKTYETTYDINPDPTYLSPSYPNVFSDKELNSNGFRRLNAPLEKEIVASVPNITQWETTAGIVPYVKELSSILKSISSISNQIGFTKDQLLEREEVLNMAADDYEL